MHTFQRWAHSMLRSRTAPTGCVASASASTSYNRDAWCQVLLDLLFPVLLKPNDAYHCILPQYYTNGAYCAAASSNRRAHMRVLCDASAVSDIVVSEKEPSTCHYEFVVYSASVWCVSGVALLRCAAQCQQPFDCVVRTQSVAACLHLICRGVRVSSATHVHLSICIVSFSTPLAAAP